MIDESVKFNNDNEGIILSIGENAINYMKNTYLPFIYNKTSNITLPEIEFNDGPISGKVRASVFLPEPEATKINDWKTSLVSKDNALRIENEREKMQIVADVEMYFYGKLQIAKGRILANFTDIHSVLDIEFGTQATVNTWKPKNKEYAPSVTLNVKTLNVDRA